MSELYELSAVDTLRAFRDGSVSPSDYLEATLDRIEVAQPVVNALGDQYVEEARAAARAAGERYARGDARPLEGLPVAIKDEAAIAGKRSTNGSLLMQDNVPDRDDPIVERLRAAGAIFHARTLTPEFEITFWTCEPDVGYHPQPVERGVRPGRVEWRIGSGACGGHDTARNRLRHRRLDPRPRLLLRRCRVQGDVGADARTASGGSRRLVSRWTARPHRRRRRPRRRCDVRPAPAGARRDPPRAAHRHAGCGRARPPHRGVGGPGRLAVVPSVRAGIRAVADALRDAGATVEETDIRIERSLVRIASDAHYAAAFGSIAQTVIAGHEELLSSYTARWLGSLQQARGFADGLEAEGQIQERLSTVFEAYDAFICPAIGVPALEAGVDYTEVPLVVDGQSYDAMREVCPTEIFNVASRCPVLCVPAGRDEGTGVPVGVQIAGRTYEDPIVFRIGAAIEAALPMAAGGRDLSGTAPPRVRLRPLAGER